MNRLIDSQLEMSETFRREKGRITATTNTEGVTDYGVSLAQAQRAFNHLSESLPGGQQNRSLNALLALSAAASELLQYGDAAGYFSTPGTAEDTGILVSETNLAEVICSAEVLGRLTPEQLKEVYEVVKDKYLNDDGGVEGESEGLSNGRPVSGFENLRHEEAIAFARNHCFTDNRLTTVHEEAMKRFNVTPGEVNELLAKGWRPTWRTVNTYTADSWINSENGLVYPNSVTYETSRERSVEALGQNAHATFTAEGLAAAKANQFFPTPPSEELKELQATFKGKLDTEKSRVTHAVSYIKSLASSLPVGELAELSEYFSEDLVPAAVVRALTKREEKAKP